MRPHSLDDFTAVASVVDRNNKSKTYRIRIQLAHVSASIIFGNWFNMQIPRIQIRMRHGNARIVCDDMLMNCLYGFCVCFHPTHLHNKLSWNINKLHSFLLIRGSFHVHCSYMFSMTDEKWFFDVGGKRRCHYI